MQVTPSDAAYAAGLIDGEGSVLLTRLSGGEYRAPVVSMPSTTRELTDYMHATFGGHVVFRKARRPRWSDAWVWNIRSNACLTFLDIIFPYMRENRKRARAELLLTEYKTVTKRNGKYSECDIARKRAFEDAFMSI